MQFANDITLSESALLAALEAPAGDRRETARRVTEAVSDGIAHYWLDEGIDRYHLRVPAWENWILHLASYVRPSSYLRYEFSDPSKAIERGVGLCSQQASIAAEALTSKGLDARMVSLGGHVVLQANVAESGQPDDWWVLDPDYRVVMPIALDELEANPMVVAKFYAAAGHGSETVQRVVGFYAAADNVVQSTPGAAAYHGKRAVLERASYLLIWIIPVALILPSLGRRQRASESQATATQRASAGRVAA